MIATSAPGFHPGLPFNQYLALEHLSPSGAKLLARSPAHYLWSRENPYPETAALLEGSALHALILEGRATYERGFAILPECDGRTKEGKAIKARFQEEAAGKRILTAAQGEKVEAMAAAVFRHPLIPALLEGGTPELSMTWEDSESGAPCKG
ncbi:MAG: PD-(D/E)XK nuclease-like domain-containing protein, partial [Chromatiaceae bacterium]|nr:PD-(D/E)XK nuclease-like domain-containing protein [Chromatiaceae bacterium]